jgi:hypothetical protein
VLHCPHAYNKTALTTTTTPNTSARVLWLVATSPAVADAKTGACRSSTRVPGSATGARGDRNVPHTTAATSGAPTPSVIFPIAPPPV